MMDLLAKSARLFFGPFPDFIANGYNYNDHDCSHNGDHNLQAVYH